MNLSFGKYTDDKTKRMKRIKRSILLLSTVITLVMSVMLTLVFASAEEYGMTYAQFTQAVSEMSPDARLENGELQLNNSAVAAKALIYLSNVNPSEYENLSISFSVANINLTGSEEFGGNTFEYRGLGNSSNPFAGQLKRSWGDNGYISFTLRTSLMNSISSDAALDEVELKYQHGAGSPDCVFAKTVEQGTGTPEGWSIKLIYDGDDHSSGGLIGRISDGAKADISLSLTDATQGSFTAYNISSQGNAGLFCNTMGENTELIISGYSHSWTHVGGDSKPTVNISAPSGSAGAIAGEAENGANIRFAVSWTVPEGTKMTVKGTTSGGLVGSAENADISSDAGKSVTLNNRLWVESTAMGGSAGGVVGIYTNSLDAEDTPFGDGLNLIFGTNSLKSNTTQAVSEHDEFGAVHVYNITAGENYLGSVIGTLIVGEGSTFTLGNNENRAVRADLHGNNAVTVVGGVIGYVKADGSYANLPKVRISRQITGVLVDNRGTKHGAKAYSFDGDRAHFAKGAGYFGGVVGRIGDENSTCGVYVEVDNCSFETWSPWASKRNGFGGVTSRLGDHSVLYINGFSLNTMNDKWMDGAGLVGGMCNNSAVCLDGAINMSKAVYSNDTATAQLIGYQKNSLVYAKSGINFTRGITTDSNSRKNDIGNYGSVIRLGGEGGLPEELFSIDGVTHKIKIKSDNIPQISAAANPANGKKTVTLESKEHFALYATAIQSRGAFSVFGNGYTADSLLRLNINFEDDIDMSHTGIFSFQRDAWNSGNETPTYCGIADGKGHTVTVTPGEAWGTRTGNTLVGDGRLFTTNIDTSKGFPSDELYQHTSIGLFRNAGDSTFKNLTVDGSIRYATYAVSDSVNGARVGGVVSTTWGTVSFENVVSAVDIDCSAGDKTSYVGGFAGMVWENSDAFTLRNCSRTGNIEISGGTSNLRFGGILGNYSKANRNNVMVLENVTVSGDITYRGNNTKVNGGGVVGEIISGNTAKTLTVNGLNIDGLEFEINEAHESSGGFLGGYFENTNVIFTENAGITVGGGSVLKASGDTEMGGLCHTATGRWTVNGGGISFENSTIANGNGNLGLIICQGQPRGLLSASNNGKGLYLELNSTESYSINGLTVTKTSNAKNKFDELVYRTCTGEDIGANGQSVITIATTGGRISRTAGELNTYKNRTKYNGTAQWATNQYARYYYNIHLFNKKTKGFTDPERMMLWALNKYAHSSISDLFKVATSAPDTNLYWPDRVGVDGGHGYDRYRADIDLSGYSYYPVDVKYSGSTPHIVVNRGTTVIFDNATVEDASRSTQALNGNKTQHFGMHCGLFRNVYVNIIIDVDSSNTTSSNAQRPELTLSGSVGMGENGSGAIINGTYAPGTAGSLKNLTLNGVVLKDLYINGYSGGEAPLLINSIGGYTNITVKSVYTESENTGTLYYQNTAGGSWYAASSLFGSIGSDEAKGIVLQFSDIRLDGRARANAGDGSDTMTDAYGTRSSIFRIATLAYSFKYDGESSGTYNFNITEDSGGALHHVTYGREINGSVKNPDSQIYYNDVDELVIAMGSSDFSSFLPYIAITRVTDGNADGYYHEIDVNVKVFVFDVGCGTYAHPYYVTKGGQLQTLEKYLISGIPGENLVVRFSAENRNSPALHSGNISGEKCYIFSNGAWYEAQYNAATQKYTATSTPAPAAFTNNVLDHLRTAYYMIRGDISLGMGFGGLGTETVPFSGIIVGELDGSAYPTVTLKGDLVSGLINVASGCVVKNINISYANIITMKNDAASEANKPAAYFGGVIGRVIGGDSIIDGVTVSVNYNGDAVLGAGEAPFLISGTKPHHVTVGGLVGAVCGGGVVIRATDRANTVDGRFFSDGRFLQTAYGRLYCNPYVGRVLDGYVIAEYSANQTSAPDNGNKQYKIPLFSDGSGKLQLNGSQISVGSADALYILSALVNSGAFERGASGAVQYSGNNYRSRGNMTYGGVGTVNGCNSADDVRNGIPYLFKYTEGTPSYDLLSAQTPVTLSVNANLDMSDFGNGFCGIGYRFRTEKPNIKLSTLNGNGNTVTLQMNVRTYTDDNFICNSTGLFNRAVFGSSTVSRLILNGSVFTTAYEPSGTEGNGTGRSVGAFAGTVNGTVTFDRLSAGNSLTVSGGYYTGGFVGTVNGQTTFLDCDCSGVTVDTQFAGGGFAGVCNGAVRITNSADRIISDVNVSGVKKEGEKALGGLVGRANNGSSLEVGDASRTLTLKDIKILAKTAAGGSEVFVGGLIGTSAEVIRVNGLKLTGSAEKGTEIGAGNGVSQNNILCGGIAGSFRGKADVNGFELSGNVLIFGNNAGGIGGRNGSYQNNGSVLKNVDIATASSDNVRINGKRAAGGIYGETPASVTLTELRIGTNGGSPTLLIYGEQYAGGVVGISNASVSIGRGELGESVLRNYRTVGNSNANNTGVGAFVGAIGTQNCELKVNDCLVKDVQILSIQNMNLGGLVGYVGGTGNIKGSNILLDGIVFGKVPNSTSEVISGFTNGYAGLWTAPRGFGVFSLVGVSAVGDALPAFEAQSGYSGYIVYADSTASGSPTASQPLDVIGSPQSGASVQQGGSSASLYGDGAALRGSDPMPRYIYDNALTGYGDRLRNGYFTSLRGGIDRDKISTYAAVQTPDGTFNDFSVLIVDKDREADVDSLIMNYLDLLTNGGAKKYFADLITVARKQAVVNVMTYKLSGGVFVPADANSIVYKVNATGDGCMFSINKGKNDRGEAQFTLITVTFSNGSDSYVLQIPVIVDKPVEVTVTIQQQSGTVFNIGGFEGDGNVKTAYGRRVTLRVEYNYSYSWSDFITDGVISGLDWNYQKKLKLSDVIGEYAEHSLPRHTRLTVIDMQKGMLAYSVKLGEEKIYAIDFNTLFAGSGWSSETVGQMLYMKPWSVGDEAPGKLWLICAVGETPEVTIGGVGYREAPASYTGDGFVLACKESYYIIIELPSDLTDEEQIFRSLNYSLSGTLTDGSNSGAIPVRMAGAVPSVTLTVISDTEVSLVKNENGESVTQENVVTSLFYSELNSRNDATVMLKMTATVSEDDRLIGTGDRRYMQFELKLGGSGAGTNTGFLGRVGINATFVINGNNEVPFNTSFSTADGNYRKLLIPVQNGSTLINLADYLCDGEESHSLVAEVEATVYLTFYADGSMSTFPISEVTDNQPDAYVKLVAAVSTSETTSFRSGTRASMPDGTVMNCYYCKSGLSPTVILYASEPNQLGINPGATGEPADGNAVIDAICTLDASVMEDERFGIESGKYDKVRFTLKLYQKNGSGYAEISENTGGFIAFASLDGDVNSGYVWEYDCSDFADENVVNRLSKQLRLEVKRTPLPASGQLKYTSYKAELEAEFYDSTAGYGASHSSAYSDHIIYLIAKISEMSP